MKNIQKRNEPQSLTQHRLSSPTDYNGYREKDELRASLHSEQRGLCCYCMGRIRAEIGAMKIEHWQSHQHYPEQRLVYSNLLGACMGGEGFSSRDQHCDTYKGDRDLWRNPADPGHNVEALIEYSGDGTITATDPVFNEQLNTVLNLNAPFLKANRKAQRDSVKKLLSLRPGRLSDARWQKLLGEWDGSATAGELRPYAGVVTYWIRQHLA